MMTKYVRNVAEAAALKVMSGYVASTLIDPEVNPFAISSRATTDLEIASLLHSLAADLEAQKLFDQKK